MVSNMLQSNFLTRELVYKPLASLKRYFLLREIKKEIREGKLMAGLSGQVRNHWEERIRKVLSAPDNQWIPRIENAGKIIGDSLIMHNGIKIDPLSYYDKPMLQMLIENKGVHEPQEERVFGEVLKKLPEGSVMLELGSYWAFYSAWFYKNIPNGKCFLVEAKEGLLELGKINFRKNGFRGEFFQAFVGRNSGTDQNGNRIITVDELANKESVSFFHIIHCDIEGNELEMLEGAKNLIENKQIGYFFISTHSPALHKECLDFLAGYHYTTVASVPPSQSYSMDGVLVMKAPGFAGVESVPVSLAS